MELFQHRATSELGSNTEYNLIKRQNYRRGSRQESRLYLIEASDQALRLLGHSSLDSPLDHSLDVLLLVLLRHGDTGSSWLQLSLCNLKPSHMEPSTFSKAGPSKELRANLPKDLLVDSEGQVQHVLDVVVLHPLEALMELLIQELQVAQVTGAAGHGGQRDIDFHSQLRLSWHQ